MAMSSADITAFVRDHLDVDASDLPDSVLDVFKREGFNRIIRSQIRWPFMERTWTKSTTIGTQSYALGGAGLELLDDITSIEDELRPILRLDHAEAKRMFPSGAATTGRPLYWSEWYRTIYLWPIPDAVYTYAIEGVTQSTDWVANNTAPTDLPEDFHELIAFWVLHRGYLQQDDPETAAFYARQFGEGLDVITRRWIHEPTDRPILLGRPAPRKVLTRALYPNEYSIGYE